MWKKWPLVLVVFLVINYSIYIFSDAKSKFAPRAIKVVMDDNYPPYVFRDESGNLQGILIDQWRLWEKKTGIKVSIDGMSWDKALKEMKIDNYDVIDTIFKNEERDELYDFTVPYEEVTVPIFFNKNISGITGVESLKGFSVAVKKGDACIDVLKQDGINDLQEFDSYEDIIIAAKEQKVNIFVSDKQPTLYYLYKYKIEDKFNYYGSLYTGELRRAVKKGHTELLEEVNLGFSYITQNEYKDINDKWYGYSYDYNNYMLLKKIITYALLAVVLFLLLLLWNKTLRGKVKEKTKELSLLIEELRSSEARVKALLQAIPDMFFLITKEGVFIDYQGKKDEDLYKYPEVFLHKNIRDVLPKELAEKFLKVIRRVIETGKGETIEYSLEVQNVDLEYEARLVLCDSDKVVGIVRDITERKLAEACLYNLSIHDTLTGLFNRNYFENQLVKLQKELPLDVGVIILDSDGLKEINDTLGHAAGDEYLIAISRILLSVFNVEGFIARIGGDEFAVLMWNTSEEQIKNLCKMLDEKIKEYNNANAPGKLSVSLGYAFSAGAQYDLQKMFKEADDRMYKEKFYHKKLSRNSLK